MSVWALAAMFLVIGCAGHRGQPVGPTAIEQAVEEIPEELLLDVGIEAFDSAELTDKQAQKEGTNAEIRKAECHFIPYHLKNTLQLSSHWGGVRLIPQDSGAADLVVGGEVISSSGEDLVLRVWARPLINFKIRPIKRHVRRDPNYQCYGVAKTPVPPLAAGNTCYF